MAKMRDIIFSSPNKHRALDLIAAVLLREWCSGLKSHLSSNSLLLKASSLLEFMTMLHFFHWLPTEQKIYLKTAS